MQFGLNISFTWTSSRGHAFQLCCPHQRISLVQSCLVFTNTSYVLPLDWSLEVNYPLNCFHHIIHWRIWKQKWHKAQRKILVSSELNTRIMTFYRCSGTGYTLVTMLYTSDDALSVYSCTGIINSHVVTRTWTDLLKLHSSTPPWQNQGDLTGTCPHPILVVPVPTMMLCFPANEHFYLHENIMDYYGWITWTMGGAMSFLLVSIIIEDVFLPSIITCIPTPFNTTWSPGKPGRYKDHSIPSIVNSFFSIVSQRLIALSHHG